MMEFQTAFMGELLDINAFDQEGVELGKKFTFGLMGRKGFEPYRHSSWPTKGSAKPRSRACLGVAHALVRAVSRIF